MDPIKINGNTIDPDGQHKALFEHMTKSEWIIVECSTNIWSLSEELKALNIHIKQRVDQYVWMCQYPPREFTNIKVASIRRVVPYHPICKIQSILKYAIEREQDDSTGTLAREKWLIGIALHERSQSSLDDVQALIRELNGPEILATDIGRGIQIRSELRFLEAIAEHESVSSIQELPIPVLH